MQVEWLNITMEEYKSLRSECINSINAQQYTLNVGIAAISALMVSAVHLWEQVIVSQIIFLVCIPLVSYLILLVWVGEIVRMMRAGYFIAKIENKINKHLKMENVLSWENWLRSEDYKKTHPKNINYYAIIILFILLSFLSIVTGNIRLYNMKIYYLIIIAVSLIEIVFICLFLKLIYKLMNGVDFKSPLEEDKLYNK